jgi:hypothetical protein
MPLRFVWPLLAALMGFALGGSYVWSLLAFPQHQTSQAHSTAEHFWEWVTHDAAGFFTALLVLVGGLQLALFFWQLVLIRESLDDAKLAAEAAKDSAEAAKLQATVAENAFRGDQRPWLAFIEQEITAITGLEYDANGVGITINFPIRNIGKTPATAVWVSFSLYPGGVQPPLDIKAERARLVEMIKARPNQLANRVVFPGDRTEQGIRTSIQAQEVERIRNTEFNMIFPIAIAVISDGFTFEPGVHVRTLTFRIGKRPGVLGTPIGEAIPLSDLEMRFHPLDSGYAD